IEAMANDTDEQQRLRSLATKVVSSFISDEIKDLSTVVEVVSLAPVLEKEPYRKLLSTIVDEIRSTTLLDFNQLEGMAIMVQNAQSDFLSADDLVQILNVLNTRLQVTHQQSTNNLYHLTMA